MDDQLRVTEFFSAGSVLCRNYGFPPGNYVLVFDDYNNVTIEGTGVTIPFDSVRHFLEEGSKSEQHSFSPERDPEQYLFKEDLFDLFKEESYGGPFTLEYIERVRKGMPGLYHIYGSSSVQYLGRSERCVRGRLLCHYGRGKGNSLIKSALQEGMNLFFECWFSPDPKYEEALEIDRMKRLGLLPNQKKERKPLIPGLDIVYLD